MALYNDLINNDTLTREQRAEAIKARGEAERKTYNTDLLKDKGRIGFGSLLSGASAHPIFNIPYVGTGIGGAMYDAGQAIAEGEKLPDIAKRAGRGFVIGETVGAIPYVGKVAGKTKVGKAVGNEANKLFNYLADTKVGQKVAEIAPKIEDALMTDIKAYNPFKKAQTAYHGSPYDFDKFSNSAIGTGEQAQAHGYGHYSALDKSIADERYRKRLSEELDGELSAEIKYLDETIKEGEEVALYLQEALSGNQGKINAIKRATKEREEILDSIDYINKRAKDDPYNYNTADIPKLREKLEKVNSALMYLEDLDNLNVNILGKNSGQLYKLSIPKDDVMLREYASFSEQPVKVQKALTDIQNEEIKKRGFNSIEEVRERLNSISDEYEKTIREQAVPFWAWSSTPVSTYQIELSKLERLNNMFDYGGSSKNIYKQLSKQLGKEEASNLLNKHGIKGISYNGGIDGEARVIFNPDDIEIVRKYYNQPELWEKLKGLKPNEGAELIAIENALRNPQFPMNEQDFNAYENLGLNYYKNIFQPNSVNVDDYGIVSFGRKNRGKDDITNFKMYPNLFELLSGAKPVNRTNYKNELDRQYDYLENPNNNIYQFIIEDIENNGKRYKMMKNKETGK